MRCRGFLPGFIGALKDYSLRTGEMNGACKALIDYLEDGGTIELDIEA